MVVNCPKCDARLQVDDSKAPAKPFNVRCPKCQANVSIQDTPDVRLEPAPEPVKTSDVSPAEPSRPLFERPSTAPGFTAPQTDDSVQRSETTAAGLDDLAKLLAEALSHSDQSAHRRKRPAWDKRKVLICASPAYRDVLAHSLAQEDYTVFVAENSAQALGRMRDEHMDVIILDGNFDPFEQGVAIMTREVGLLRPSERRRLFLVYLTGGVRTLDLHAAFLQNVNLVVNPSDVAQLPEALEISIRHYNELYREFNVALGVTPI
jgi:predicted Zn finger-like uncharacterized protein